MWCRTNKFNSFLVLFLSSKCNRMFELIILHIETYLTKIFRVVYLKFKQTNYCIKYAKTI